jgi:hypothetical protein
MTNNFEPVLGNLVRINVPSSKLFHGRTGIVTKLPAEDPFYDVRLDEDGGRHAGKEVAFKRDELVSTEVA